MGEPLVQKTPPSQQPGARDLSRFTTRIGKWIENSFECDNSSDGERHIIPTYAALPRFSESTLLRAPSRNPGIDSELISTSLGYHYENRHQYFSLHVAFHEPEHKAFQTIQELGIRNR